MSDAPNFGRLLRRVLVRVIIDDEAGARALPTLWHNADFAEELAMFCRRYDCIVEFEFNETPGVAWPGQSASDIIDEWAAKRDEKAK